MAGQEILPATRISKFLLIENLNPVAGLPTRLHTKLLPHDGWSGDAAKDTDGRRAGYQPRE
jgi:hypothetical protein